MISRLLTITKNEGLKGLYQAFKRYIYWHPLTDYYDDFLCIIGRNEKIINIFDLKMKIDLRDKGISRDLYHNKIREPECTKIFMNELQYVKNGNILDIGANIGYYVLLEAKRTNGHIYAVEPDPRNFALLRENIKINNLENRVKLYNVALGDKEGKIKFAQSSRYNWSKVANERLSYNEHMNYIEVKITTVDKLVKDTPISYMRFDVEGYEYFIVKGAKKTLEQNDNLRIFAEIHPTSISAYGGNLKELLEFLSEFDFKIKYFVDTNWKEEYSRNPPLRFTRKNREPPVKVIKLNLKLSDALSDEKLKNLLLHLPYHYHIFLEK